VPAPAPPVPGTSAAAAASIPAAPDPVTPWLASGVSQLLSPPPLNLPSIPGVGIPLPSQLPVPSDLLCVGTDWSASQGDHGAQSPSASTVNGRDRWATPQG
jgi:collagen type IV alpha